MLHYFLNYIINISLDMIFYLRFKSNDFDNIYYILMQIQTRKYYKYSKKFW